MNRNLGEFPTGFISEKCVFQDAFLNTMPTSSSDLVAIERPKTDCAIFAHTRWDVIPLAAGILHCVYFFGNVYQFLSRGSQNRPQGTEAQEPARGVLGNVRVNMLRYHVCYSRNSKLALHLFPSSVLVFWPLPLLSERLLSAFRGQSR